MQRKSATTTAVPATAVMHEHVFERLRELIISGQFAPGSTISVRRLASEFGVSAMPARDAIRRMIAIGALETTQTRRVTIATMSAEKLAEIKLARLALEPKLASKALENVRARPRQKKQLLDALKQADAEIDKAIKRGDAADYARFNSDFHFTLYHAAQSTVLMTMVESLWLQFGPFMRVVVGRLGTSWIEEDRHKEAIAALRDNRPEDLEKAVYADISDGLNNISEFDFRRR